MDDHNLSRINFHYRYSQDNISWSDWTFYASRNVSGSLINGTFTFDPSSLLGEGYYDIFVEAVDDKGQLAHMLNRAKLRGGFDKTLPVIASHSRFPEDIVEPNQPVKITVNVTDSLSGVKNVTLSYRIRGESAWNNILMTLNQISMLYEATIIIHQPNVNVEYMITAYDNAGNKIVENNSGQCYSYSVVPEYPIAFMPLLIMLGISLVFIIATKKNCKPHPDSPTRPNASPLFT